MVIFQSKWFSKNVAKGTKANCPTPSVRFHILTFEVMYGHFYFLIFYHFYQSFIQAMTRQCWCMLILKGKLVHFQKYYLLRFFFLIFEQSMKKYRCNTVNYFKNPKKMFLNQKSKNFGSASCLMVQSQKIELNSEIL